MKKDDGVDLREVVTSVIIVTRNDENLIDRTLKQINEVLNRNYPNYEILIIDNNSFDNTINKIRSLYLSIPNIRIIKLSKTYDMDIAFTAGLDNCIGDYALLLDIHFVSPKKIPLFLKELVKGYGLVISKSEENIMPKWSLSYIFLSLVEKLSTHDFSYKPIYFMGLNRRVINSITRIKRKNRNFSYIINSIGFRKTSITYKELGIDKAKIKVPNFLELLFSMTDIIISNSFKPMRALALIGMLISLMFLLFIFVDAILTLFLKTYIVAPKGWTSLSLMLGLTFFLLFSLLMLISEYIIRILGESRNDPLYFISEEMDKSVININKNKLNVI